MRGRGGGASRARALPARFEARAFDFDEPNAFEPRFFFVAAALFRERAFSTARSVDTRAKPRAASSSRRGTPFCSSDTGSLRSLESKDLK